ATLLSLLLVACNETERVGIIRGSILGLDQTGAGLTEQNSEVEILTHRQQSMTGKEIRATEAKSAMLEDSKFSGTLGIRRADTLILDVGYSIQVG
ncbi:hypothetical protein SKAU_G00106120, partial [Synaphobranchus kaupii]